MKRSRDGKDICKGCSFTVAFGSIFVRIGLAYILMYEEIVLAWAGLGSCRDLQHIRSANRAGTSGGYQDSTAPKLILPPDRGERCAAVNKGEGGPGGKNLPTALKLVHPPGGAGVVQPNVGGPPIGGHCDLTVATSGGREGFKAPPINKSY